MLKKKHGTKENNPSLYNYTKSSVAVSLKALLDFRPDFRPSSKLRKELNHS
jgi:hypothetical protein